MKSLILKISLILYSIFQCAACLVSFLLIAITIYGFILLVILTLSESQGKSLGLINYAMYATAIGIILLAILNTIITIISTIATFRIIKQQPLTKLQKFSIVIFIIITALSGSYLIFELCHLYFFK